MNDNHAAQACDLSLGFEPIDSMHEEFLQHCNALAVADEADVADCLARLDAFHAHCVEHFRQENEWMRATGYGPAGCHAGEHESALAVLRQVREKVLAGERGLIATLAQEMPQWFVHHVLSMDNQLAAFLKECGGDRLGLPQPAAVAR
jgi:hemerythrin-like metal-binding protein